KNTVKESSYSRTELIFIIHLLLSFGKIEITKISTAYCQKIVNTWHPKGSSTQYPLFINYMNQVFKLAINIGVINQNPVIN
ncbi:site-specific integrase, partial [Enterococcus faecalis]